MAATEKQNVLVLAALLHDIGKLKWRANKLQAGYTHEIYSEEIFSEFIAHKKCITPIKDEIAKLIKHHGNPILTAINKADHLDAASNRKGEENNDSRRPLISVLSQIELNNSPNTNYKKDIYYYDPVTVSIDNVYPNILRDMETENWKCDTEEMIKKHAELFNSFIEELKYLPDGNLESYIDSLLFLYEKYLCYVTSAGYNNVPDISLYDHNKTVAALASCYSDTEDKEKPFLIIAADISGIQNFIYAENNIDGIDVGLKAKRLRGKSFFLSLLTDAFSNYLLRVFNVSRANLLINGGGHFIIIVPNSDYNRNLFAEERNKIQLWFFKTFHGELNLILEKLEADDDLYKKYPAWHDKISHLLLQGKKRKSIDILDKVFALDLDKSDYSAFKTELNGEEREEYKTLNNYEKYLYMQNRLFENIGFNLPYADYILEVTSSSIENIRNAEKKIVPFEEFHTFYIFIKNDASLISFLNDNKNSQFDFLRIMRINEPSFDYRALGFNILKSISYPVSVGFKLIGKVTAKNEDEGNLEFKDLAVLNNEAVNEAGNEKGETDKKELDYPLLAILRMDVDNLGSIFSIGLKREDENKSVDSLARIVNLSRDMNLFFLGHLNTIAEKWGIYITYSGGDDLFVVGSWINILNFSLEAKKEFSRFACYNPDVTISGGIYLCKPNYPIGKSAKFAGEKEKLAKEKSKDKNCISVFGEEISWTNFEVLHNYGKELDKLVESDNMNERVSPGYLHFLLTQTSDMFKEEDEDPKQENTSSFIDGYGKRVNMNKYFNKISKIKYSIARSPRNVNAESIAKLPEKPNEKVRLLSKLISDDKYFLYLRYFVIPASYVIFKNRNSKNKGEKNAKN